MIQDVILDVKNKKIFFCFAYLCWILKYFLFFYLFYIFN
uniref:Transmembrane protein n=1 Tax=Medicago truncatula TaxID=3880 RepID=I3S4A2_MEDTR|nr:unknown [Medicago truncatula]